MGEETHYQRIMRWFNSHKSFAWLMVLVMALAGAGSVVGALDALLEFYKKYSPSDDRQRVYIDPQEIMAIPATSYGYFYDVFSDEIEGLGVGPDYLDHGAESKLAIYEDGVLLSTAHASHQEIRELGAGRYSHWRDDADQEYIFFSATDNSDPRQNGREYRVQSLTGMSLLMENAKISAEKLPSMAYRYRGEGLVLSPANSKCDGSSAVSKLQIIEIAGQRETLLYPAHSSRLDIQTQGEGRYNHCKDGTTVWLFFSASDNSDPRSTDRRYALTVSN